MRVLAFLSLFYLGLFNRMLLLISTFQLLCNPVPAPTLVIVLETKYYIHRFVIKGLWTTHEQRR